MAATERALRVTCHSGRREQTRGEEIANSVSHGVGLVAALVATPFLLIQADTHDDLGFLIGAGVFATSMVLLYLASAIYHALPASPAKGVIRVVEHSAIYVLIAGTYTPFTLGILKGPWGWSLLGLVWCLALAGVALKAYGKASHPILSTGLYLVMGWLIVIAAEPLYTRVPLPGLLWLVAGGMAYTIGVIFYTVDAKFSYAHFIWHLFVLTGTSCHYFAVLWYGT
ncbi:hemolysin D [Pseudothauera lacus]|uniref:Hemolysin D n=2 Tax=Pseudothauera lacus TaxID=2136175 RepID=A0A2T4IFM6_9RHOO|nr:hemolysin D [Pseudothauera lacus]